MAAGALIPRFQLSKLLNQDQGGRRITLLGTIDSSPALLTAERAAFPTDAEELRAFHASLANINNLGANDIYSWYLASTWPSGAAPPDLKLNLIYPCTEQHIKKYSSQAVRMVTETPEIYAEHVRPLMQRKREEGRLNWVWNIIDGKTEQEDVLLRDHGRKGVDDEGFLMLPDLNWDRKTISSLHLLGIVERRDIWSLRDLKKKHVGWLKHMREQLLHATAKLYPGIEKDMLKLYMHWMCHLAVDIYDTH
ncbi:mrna decapping hydrolase [Lasallia pustulata]|uniref:Mrna decapping hydrolase n=1 Tax=Lasallia pustulata TaxID=136370 RepID=A0A1W5D995_9LECA|nr:mrna decapping hydrolase [Lasallia pustulata]